VKFTIPIPSPPYEGPPLPFAINVKRNAMVDLTGVQFLCDEVDTPIHPHVESFQARRIWDETWMPMYNDWGFML
jgi:hypothetical protein